MSLDDLGRRAQIAGLARGAAVLGTGGGGDPYIGALLADAGAHARTAPSTVVDARRGARRRAWSSPVAMMGAPTVMVEKLPRARRGRRPGPRAGAVPRPARSRTSPAPRSAASTRPSRSSPPPRSACRSSTPTAWAAPSPSCRWCCRPCTASRATPMAFADEKGNTGVLTTVDNRWTERIARVACVEMGCSAMISQLRRCPARRLREAIVAGSLSLCRGIGDGDRCRAAARTTDPVARAVAAARRPGAVHRQGRRRRARDHHRVRPRSRPGSTAARRGASSCSFQNEHLWRSAGRRGPRHDARPDHRARARLRRADHHRGAALRPAGPRHRRAVRRALAQPGRRSRWSGRGTSATTCRRTASTARPRRVTPEVAA